MDYKEYIKDCMGSEPPKNSVEEAYKVFPAFMKQDTEEGKKENYNAIHDSFKELDQIFYKEHQEVLLPKAGLYLMSLVDTMSVMSQEIFEHYKYFETLYKKALKKVLAFYQEETSLFPTNLNRPADSNNPVDITGTFMIAYAVLKGCRMKAILSEKYLDMGKAMYQAAEKIIGKEAMDTLDAPLEMKLAHEEYKKVVDK